MGPLKQVPVCRNAAKSSRMLTWLLVKARCASGLAQGREGPSSWLRVHQVLGVLLPPPLVKSTLRAQPTRVPDRLFVPQQNWVVSTGVGMGMVGTPLHLPSSVRTCHNTGSRGHDFLLLVVALIA